MDLDPGDAAFLLDEMSRIETDDDRHSSERHAAGKLRREAERVLTE